MATASFASFAVAQQPRELTKASVAVALKQPPILVAPDSFKGTFTAREVAEAVAAGVEDGGRAADRCPLADGGEGTMEALTTGVEGVEFHEVEVTAPMGDKVTARFATVGQTAIVETAEAIGLVLVPESDRNPEVATSRGAGEMIAAAVEAGASEILVGVGGSATVDGGRGTLEALADAGLVVTGPRRPKGFPSITVLCDARATWEEAAKIFGPQKGADPAAVARLTEVMVDQAKTMRKDPIGVNYTGGAGGVSGVLWSEAGAELLPGAPYVMERVGFDERMRASRSVIVGEGRLDSSTLIGKAPGEAATRARQAGFGCAAVCGVNGLDLVEERIIDLQVVIEAGDLKALRAAGQTLAGLI